MVKKILQMIINFVANPKIRFGYLTKLGLFNQWSDEKFLKKKYKVIMGKELDLENPKSFNEKLQWLKIYDKNPIYTTMVDKYAVKEYVAEKIGKEYIIPTLGVWKHFDDIDFDKLPNQFVLKCTHDSGSVVLVPNKENFDKKTAKKKLERCLHRNFYYIGREWPYKSVLPRIIAEQYMSDEFDVGMKDYKIFNFSGEPKLIQVDYDRFVEHKRNLYTTDWQYIEAAIQYPADPTHQIERPKRLEKMLDLARTLSVSIPHVRTDFYCIDDKIYFGELTFYHGSGFEKFTPESFGKEMGKWLKLPLGGYLLINDFAVFVLKEEDKDKEELTDYKIMCFEGEPKLIQVHEGRKSGNHTQDFYDLNWNRLEIEQPGMPHSALPMGKPRQLEQILKFSKILAQGIHEVRVDWYISNEQIYFGELTFYDGAGFDKFYPEKWDDIMGGWINVP